MTFQYDVRLNEDCIEYGNHVLGWLRGATAGVDNDDDCQIQGLKLGMLRHKFLTYYAFNDNIMCLLISESFLHSYRMGYVIGSTKQICGV